MPLDDLDNSANGEWLTITDAADRLGISAKSVRSRITRGRIRTRSGKSENDGLTKVWVPVKKTNRQAESAVDTAVESTADSAIESTADSTEDSAIAAMRIAIESLGDQLEDLTADRDTLKSELSETRSLLDTERQSRHQAELERAEMRGQLSSAETRVEMQADQIASLTASQERLEGELEVLRRPRRKRWFGLF